MFKLFSKEYSEEYKYLSKLLSRKNDWEFEKGYNNALRHKISGIIVIFTQKERIYRINRFGNGVDVFQDTIKIIETHEPDEYSLARHDYRFPGNKKEVKKLSKIILSYVEEMKNVPIRKVLKKACQQIS